MKSAAHIMSIIRKSLILLPSMMTIIHLIDQYIDW